MRDLIALFSRLDPARRDAIDRILRRAEEDIIRELGPIDGLEFARVRDHFQSLAMSITPPPAPAASRWGSN